MSRQGLCQQRLLAALLQRLYSLPSKPLRLNGATFGEQRARAGIVNLGNRSRIFQFKEEETSAIEMLVRILVSSDRKEQKTKIVFYAREIAFVSRLLKVKTRGRVFDQCLV